ncbi:MAG: DUF3365 domain-containing protein [Desulfobulbaceae bacterium]|nr:DUF3365 domain-containing protein [Desulfobulbaceae bacterium]
MMIQYLTDLNLRNKFLIWAGLLVCCFGLLASSLYYVHLRSILIRNALDTSEVILLEVESIREYVKEVLRPTISKLESRDTFVIEAMSSTFVSLNIMRRFNKKMPGYTFRRAALNPLNPQNRADDFEEEMFSWFEDDRSRTLWRGIVPREGQLSFVTIVPDYMEKSCLRCHGDARRAPAELIKRYGTKGGFRFKEGDLAGINSISIPVAGAFARIKRDSFVVFVAIQAGAAALLFLLSILFNRLVIKRLTHVSSGLLEENGEVQNNRDELDLLRQSVKTLSRYVTAARKGAGLQPNFVGCYVLGPPITAGTLSWLYEGHGEDNPKKVSIKIGFNQVLNNPLYATCLRAELKMLRTVGHNCIPEIIEHKDDILIMEPMQGTDLIDWMQSSRNQGPARKTILAQICDLVATLHVAGIVHHDLRPEIFLIIDGETGENVKITDMGLASWREIPDVILSSGLGPQGDFRYMAPEQIQGRRGDPRSDIYTIGVLLYRMFTGTMPFERQNSSIKTWLHIKKAVQAPFARALDISPELERIISKAMAGKRASRYQWIEDLWEDLDREL